ncbi:alpha/beta fold hydrolase [Terriglobus saanensis]|nr:alpha/beta hydrolase [Terriglobus saanensis]
MYPAKKHQLYLNCIGERRGPVVVFESGLDNTSSDWSKVQTEVAKFTEACSYDRAGLGKSTTDATPGYGPAADTLEEKVEDLRQLLLSAHIPPPYLSVGHSAGGILVRRFASKYPDTVQGMVLVDSAHEEQVWRFIDIDPKVIQGVSLKPDDLRKGGMLPARERFAWNTQIPLIVIEHGRSITRDGLTKAHEAEFEAAMHWMQKDLASRSPQGELRTAKHSGHDIELEEPAVVTRAIQDIWDKLETGK